MRTLEAVGVALVTLSLVVTQPRGLNEGLSALLGGTVMLLLQIVSPFDAARTEASSWNLFVFFLGMMAIAGLADQSGVIAAVAFAAARVSRGSVRTLYGAIFVAGIVISLFFANDSAALLLTPVVYTLVMKLRLDPIPFVFATTFIADSASIGLPVSNPLNIIVVDAFRLDLGSYVSHLWLPACIAVAINLAVFLWIFRRSLRGRFGPLSAPARHSGMSRTVGILAAIAVAYLVASALHFPLGPVAGCGAGLLAFDLRLRRELDVDRLRRDIGPSIFAFLAGMLLVVRGLDAAGVTRHIGTALASAAQGSHLTSIAVAVVGTAIGSNLINNLPMALVMTSAVPHLHVAAGTRSDLIYGTIVGADLGPNLTHLGSLATFIWLFFLRRKGLAVSTWDYLRLGLLTTPMMLIGAILGLWLASCR